MCAAGAVKITPAHDPNDFLVGKRHSLEFINILDDNGNINDNGASFKGQPRFQVRRGWCSCDACRVVCTLYSIILSGSDTRIKAWIALGVAGVPVLHMV
jgi:hypothetical protein